MTAENESTQDNGKPEPETVKNTEQQPNKGPGEILKEAREAKGLSQREVADQLRLRKQIIELLEADDYSTFSTPTFIKGYLRAYAKLLDLDDTEVFQAYKAKGFQEVESSQMQSFSKRKTHQKNDNRLMLITYVVIIIAVGLVIWWWQEPDLGFSNEATGTQENSQISSVGTDDETNSVGGIEISSQPIEPQISPNEEEAILESEVSSGDTNVAVESVQQPFSEDETLNSESNNASSVADETPTEPTFSDEPPTSSAASTESTDNVGQSETEMATATTAQSEQALTEQPTQPEASSANLVLEFTEECWVKIDDSSGETQAVGVKAAGYRMPVPGNAPFSITLCKPEAVEMSFNGNTVDMSEFRRGRVARFTVPMSE